MLRRPVPVRAPELGQLCVREPRAVEDRGRSVENDTRAVTGEEADVRDRAGMSEVEFIFYS
jgi:hypothetical protein